MPSIGFVQIGVIRGPTNVMPTKREELDSPNVTRCDGGLSTNLSTVVDGSEISRSLVPRTNASREFTQPCR
jgi:hypothetical protein